MEKVVLNLCTDDSLNTDGVATGLAAKAQGEASHDQVKRVPSEQQRASKVLWQQVKLTANSVERDDAVLISGNTVQENAWLDQSRLVCCMNDHCSGPGIRGVTPGASRAFGSNSVNRPRPRMPVLTVHSSVLGQKAVAKWDASVGSLPSRHKCDWLLINALHRRNRNSVRLAFRLAKMSIQSCDILTKALSQISGKAKGAVMPQMTEICVQDTSKFRVILKDRWLLSEECFNFNAARGRHVVAAIRDGWRFARNDGGRAKKRIVQFGEPDCQMRTCVAGWLEGDVKQVPRNQQAHDDRRDNTGTLRHPPCGLSETMMQLSRPAIGPGEATQTSSIRLRFVTNRSSTPLAPPTRSFICLGRLSNIGDSV